MDHSDTGGSQQVEPTAGSPRTSKARHGHVGGGTQHMLPQKLQYRHPMQQQVRQFSQVEEITGDMIGRHDSALQAMVFAQHPYGPAMMAYPGAQFGMPMAQYTMSPYPMAPPGAGFPPPQQQQQQQFMARAPQVPTNNLFYKTRMCNKWRTGACPFGDKCTYAHGQHEIRRVPAEVVAAHAMHIQHVEMNDGGHTQQPQGNANAAKNDEQNKSQLYYKTRLCIRFMQSGYCVKGNECTFAHGYEDLRLMGSSQHQKHPAQRGERKPTEDRRQEHLTEEQARARAMSAIAGVGQAENATDPESIKEATASIEDGRAFEGGPYSDTV